MKITKLLLSIILIGMVSCCEEAATGTKPSEYVITLEALHGTELKVVEIEGCEYFVGYYSTSMLLTHKGNCKNFIHKGNNNQQ